MNGNPVATNTPQERARWESTPEKRGIQLHPPDELVLPGDAAPRLLRADEVKNDETESSRSKLLAPNTTWHT